MNQEITGGQLWDTYRNMVEEAHKLSDKINMLIEALKKIRDNEETDLGVYASFCENTAREALEKITLPPQLQSQKSKSPSNNSTSKS